MSEQKKEVAAQWWAECDKRIYDFPEKPARSIFEQGFVAGQAAQEPEPSTEVKRSRLYEIAEYLRGLGNDADASHVENCALDMVSMKHEIQTAMRGNKVSIDISTCDDDAGAREFATIIGKQPDIDGSVIWLCELDHYNDDAKPIDSEGEHMTKTYTLRDIKQAFIDGFYDGAGDPIDVYKTVIPDTETDEYKALLKLSRKFGLGTSLTINIAPGVCSIHDNHGDEFRFPIERAQEVIEAWGIVEAARVL